MLHFFFTIYSVAYTVPSGALTVAGYVSSWPAVIAAGVTSAILSLPFPAQFLRIARSSLQKVHWTF